MDGSQYAALKHELETFLIRHQWDNDIPDEWLLRMMLEIAQSRTVRFREVDGDEET